METSVSNQQYEIQLKAKIRRISSLLTKQEIAKIAGVSLEDVDLFERDQPMNHKARRKLLDAYIYKKTINQYLFNRSYQS